MPQITTERPMDIDLRQISDDALHAEYRRRQEIERSFVWAVSLMRDYAVWETESGRARKITEWHARQIAERLCCVLGVSREAFAACLIEDSHHGACGVAHSACDDDEAA